MSRSGKPYPVKDLSVDQNISSKLTPTNSRPKIISARKKRKNYDSFGNLIPDDDVIAIKESQGQDGKRLVYYKEVKTDSEEVRK